MKIDLNDEITIDNIYCLDSITELLRAEGWKAYLDDIDKLKLAFSNSLITYEILKNGKLIGYVRLLGDGIHTLLIQDILIRKDEKGKGIGTMVVKEIMEMYKTVRQKIVLCDDEEGLIAFYDKLGFKKIKEYGIQCFGKF